MIEYIGDISKNDALVLKEMAEMHSEILEFGCGASTQVLAKYAKDGCMSTVDTSEEWIMRTYENIALLAPESTVVATSYDNFMSTLSADSRYDFIFDDGVDHLRRGFALKTWPHLKIGGVLGFHDTRRAHDFRNVLEVLATFQDEIGRVEFNYKSSNITLVWKKEAQPFDNWQLSEGKEPWQYGLEPTPEYIKEQLRSQNES